MRIAEVFLSCQGDEMYGEALDAILDIMESGIGLFGYINDDGDLVAPSLTRSVLEQCRVEGKDLVFPRDSWAGLWGRALIEMKTQVSNVPLKGIPPGHLPIERFIGVPLVMGGKLIGLVNVANKKTDYTGKDIETLERICAVIAPALDARLRLISEKGRRKLAEEDLDAYSQRLTERIKELNCLYSISDIIEGFDTPLEMIFSGTISILPTAWQYPDITCARIIFEGKEYCTEGFKTSPWGQRAPIVVDGVKMGVIEVYYGEEKDERDEGPFRKEECFLIEEVAERLGRIVKLRIAEEKLRRSEQWLSTTLESIGDAVVATDLDGHVAFINQAAEELTGWPAADAVGALLENVLNISYETNDRSAGGGLVFLDRARKTWLTRKDGVRIPVSHSASPIKDSNGKISGVVLVSRNVAREIQAEGQRELVVRILETLNRSLDKRESIETITMMIKDFMEVEAVGIRLVEDDDYPYYVTSGFQPMFVKVESSLCSRGEDGKLLRGGDGRIMLDCMCGRVIRGELDPELGVFTPNGSFCANDMPAALESLPDEKRIRIRGRCATFGYNSVILIPLRSEGENVGLMQLNDPRPNRFTPELVRFLEGLAASISVALRRARSREELTRSEMKFRTLYESMSETVVLHEIVRNQEGAAVDYRIIDANPAFELLTGIPAADAKGRLASDLYGGEPPYMDIYAMVAETGETAGFETYYEPLKKYMSVSVNSTEKGRFATITTDITERRFVEDELSKKNKELEAFAYTVSHDLKAPLVTIDGFAGAILEDMADALPADARRYLERISAAAKKMRNLIDDVLYFSRIGQRKENVTETAFSRIVVEAVLPLKPIMKERGVRFTVKKSGAVIRGQRTRIVQVFENLISNALKYIGDDNPAPEVEIGAIRENGRDVFYVRDNGVGINEKFHKRIFGIFERFSTTVDGNGVGLAIVKKIIDSHEGMIRVESKLGEGSAFYFTFAP